jgi:hypothetical protein
MRSLRLVPALALATVLLPGPGHAETLNVTDIIGTWVGTCTQVETGVETRIVGTFSQNGPEEIFGEWGTNSTFFGCPATSPGGYILQKGHGRSAFTDHRIHIRTREPVDPFGKMVIRTKGTTFKVKGKKACDGAGPKKYSGKGTLDASTLVFTLGLKAKVEGEIAHFDCSWHRF